jgi:hypothetical protein
MAHTFSNMVMVVEMAIDRHREPDHVPEEAATFLWS